MNCPACAFSNAPGVRFCGGCGKPIDAGPPAEAERRQLTVVFCDLVGATALSQSLDPEDLRELIAAYQQVCSEAVHRHDGHIAQYLGDGVLIYFGYPRAHEDDARRAVSCSLEILTAMRGFAHAHAERLGERLQVRIGAHTGRVVVGAVGAGPTQESLALGDTPNIASRLASIAEPDTLVVSDSTYRIVGGFVVGASLGRRELKGVSEATHVWRVLGTSGAESRLEVAGELTPYVGRATERAALNARWKEARSGLARFVTVRGEAGIGKSRLVEVFRRGAEGPDVEVLDVRCTSYSQDSAFLPIIQLIERRLGLDRTASSEERIDRLEQRHATLGITDPDSVRLVADLLSIPTGDRYPALDLSPVRRRARTLEVLVATVHTLALRRPTLLVADDLHWADPSTLELLHLIVSSSEALPMLGVFTARPEFEPPWPAGSAVGLIELTRLGNADVEAILSDVARGKAMPGEVVREIIQRSDGIPLFVEEVARAVLESGTLEERETSWALTGPLPVGLIPATVDASLTARIDRLGEARATAQLGATIGREFSLPLIQGVSEREEGALRQDLQRIVDSGLLREGSSGSHPIYIFKHALVRDAAYESLLRSTRQRFHEQIARVLRSEFQSEVEHQPEVVARHLTGAGNDAEATAYWEAAGQLALGRTAMHEAAAHLRRALDGISRLPQDPQWLERELDLQNEIAPVLMTVQGWGAVQVRHACERARELATQLGRYDKIYPAMWGLWTYYFLRGEMDEAATEAKAVLEIAEASGVPMLQITGRHATAYTMLYRGEFEEALAEADVGLALFDLEQERALAATFQLSSSVCLRAARASALWMLGRLKEADEEFNRMIRLGRELGHRPSLAAALAFALHSGLYRRWHSGEVAEQASMADELRILCKDEGFFLWHAVALTYHGAAMAAEGATDQADTEIRDGLQEFVQTGSRLTLVPMNVMCADARVMLGQDEEALRLLAEAQTEADTRGERLFEPEIDRVRGTILARRGDVPAAEASLRRAMAKARAQKARTLELRAALSLYDVLCVSGRPDEGRQFVADAVQPFARESSHPEVTRARELASV